MIFIDTHTHLCATDFDLDRFAVIQNALASGIQHLIIPAIDAETTQQRYDLAAQFPSNIHLMMGLHPTHVKDNYLDELAHVEQELSQRQFCAVGEIGIDLYWDKTYLKAQQIAFEQQINMAKKWQLPINIHCREAFDEVFEILEAQKSPELRGVFHCFSGNLAQANQAIDCGMALGIGGVVTFKNGKIDRFLHEIPLQHIVLETDAPYLAPVPHRGKRNESQYIVLIAQKLAEIYQKPLAEIAEVTTQNAQSIFGIK
ncbi:TatD family hydrolase [Flavobacterium branchiophilum]|uniref:Hydrolase TatD n=1 Tax=Flavobacterium branchiophilum TaxID=55197 RepID=A0A2H3KKE9_9FLAO|nr:TatD family hydrolase [Flavobacterium branchiophilum]PDS25573.1 hydrolase TatD [Flavobacterium branchiophilum]